MKISISKLFTVLLVMYPILYVYQSPIGSLSLTDTLLIVLYPFIFYELLHKKRIVIDEIQLTLLLFVLVNLVISSVFSTSNFSDIVRNQGHFLLILLTLAVVVPSLFRKEMGMRLLCEVSLISSIYLLMQVFFIRAFGIYISAHVSFLIANISGNGHVRPFAFFAEPAGFGFFNAIGLATVLMYKPFSEKMNRLMIMIITLALLLSLSSTSIALLIIILGWYLLSKLKNPISQIGIKPITLFFIAAVIALFIVANGKMNIVSTIYHHIAPTSDGMMAGGVYNRLGNISNIGDDYYFGAFETMFGHGMVELVAFLPAVVRTYVYFGVIGYIALITYFARLYKSSSSYGRLLILMVIANSFFGDSIYGLAMFGYMQYVMITKKIYRRATYGAISEMKKGQEINVLNG